MRPKALIFFLLFFVVLKSNSQTTGVVYYKFYDALRQPFNYKLYFSPQKSIFFSNRGIKHKFNATLMTNGKLDTFTSIMDKKFEDAIMNGKQVYVYYNDQEGDVVYKDFENKTLIAREINKFKPYIITEPFNIKKEWKFSDSTKLIGKFKCKKAVTTFRGREFEAWYTEEIPPSNGPWKLDGLPGLILEAQSKDKNFKFSFEGIEFLIQDTSLIKPPTSGIKIALLDYRKEIQKIENQRIQKLEDNNHSGLPIAKSNLPELEIIFDDLITKK